MAGAGYKLFNTGDVLTAAQVNTYLQEQTVMVFASSAARTSALSGVLAEGMVSYLQDTNAVEVYNGSAWVGVSGAGDVTEVQAGTGISVASGTGPIPVVTNTMATAVDAKGDLIVGTGADTFARLAVGTNGHTLVADSSTATGLAYAAPAAGGSFVGCSVYDSNATQSIATGTDTVVTFNSEFFDTDGFHSTSSNTGRITIPSGKGGKYLFIASGFFVNLASGKEARFYKNGNQLLSYGWTSASGVAGTSISAILDLVATDYIEFRVVQGSGGNADLYKSGGAAGEYAYFQCQFLGA
tara:strand:- start:860 stop:1750 length:891 start_codon:yes stop_codon:yes gene_type:complete